MTLLEVKNVSKRYGKIEALKDVSFVLDKGIYGIIGPNGAGKSTLFKILTTSIEQSSGEILYDGKDISKEGALYRKKIGYMPQQHKSYDHLSAIQFLYYMAALKGITKQEAKSQIETLSKRVHLEDVLGRKIGSYSGGMRQRLMFIQALLGDPEIVLLDEPTSGLDPYERIVMRNHIFDIAQDKIVLIATHVMQDIEYIADELLLIRGGKLIQKNSSVILLEELNGLVCEKIVKEEELNVFIQSHKIARMTKTKEGIRVRYISKEKKEEALHADLEDLYLHYMCD